LLTALFMPLFDELSEPRVAVEIAVAAEDAGWDGVFVWDHLLWDKPVERLADPWIVMSAIAQATERIRIGPMVTPIPRRRPQKLARETVTLDRLSDGRSIFGAGLGGDRGGELSQFGEELDRRTRADMLDEGLDKITRWWAGDEVDGVRLLPAPCQQPRIPVWIGSRFPNRRPVRRAAHWDGWFPVDVPSPDALAEVIAYGLRERPTDAGPWEVAVQGPPGGDPRPWVTVGATWWLTRFEAVGVSRDAVLGAVRDGPPR
jgi:alkanesulfonate monooxygenase SsuD/methylene tetrahydromethanopterin reductase-like flavin-dependent oxidoreductase (luciferase family)